MSTVKSLSSMMNPGAVLAGGDCETCGKSGDTPKVVTRVAMANIEKLNTPVQKVAAAPKVEVSSPNLAQAKSVQATPEKRTLLTPNKPQSEAGK